MPSQRKSRQIPSQSKPTLVTRSMLRRNDPSADVLKVFHTALEARNACGLTSSFDLLSKKSPQAPLCLHVLNKYRAEEDCRMTFHNDGIKSYWRAKTHCCDFYGKKLIRTLMENYDEGVYNSHPQMHPLQQIPPPSYMKRYMSPTKAMMNLQFFNSPVAQHIRMLHSASGIVPASLRQLLRESHECLERAQPLEYPGRRLSNAALGPIDICSPVMIAWAEWNSPIGIPRNVWATISTGNIFCQHCFYFQSFRGHLEHNPYPDLDPSAAGPSQTWKWASIIWQISAELRCGDDNGIRCWNQTGVHAVTKWAYLFLYGGVVVLE
ncbi:hypothetical protein EDD18DRAFT_1112466 [Armillaria luteobubalina]|uniref:Uncharacterized protein n=1 Tax=Armillaria luteobubalina TaxID=153913 RepID=A0AA39PEZ7_9AGAR|nr:hypothetical protein EDD18DRAFT_1112466 [Armillaria luteobubalina]